MYIWRHITTCETSVSNRYHCVFELELGSQAPSSADQCNFLIKLAPHSSKFEHEAPCCKYLHHSPILSVDQFEMIVSEIYTLLAQVCLCWFSSGLQGVMPIQISMAGFSRRSFRVVIFHSHACISVLFVCNATGFSLQLLNKFWGDGETKMKDGLCSSFAQLSHAEENFTLHLFFSTPVKHRWNTRAGRNSNWLILVLPKEIKSVRHSALGFPLKKLSRFTGYYRVMHHICTWMRMLSSNKWLYFMWFYRCDFQRLVQKTNCI